MTYNEFEKQWNDYIWFKFKAMYYDSRMSQNKFGEKFGLPKGDTSRYLNRKKSISKKIAVRIFGEEILNEELG